MDTMQELQGLHYESVKQHDVTTRRYDNDLFDYFDWEELVLRVNKIKQHDVTTRRYYKVMFDYID